jgi:hypothetical protein
VWLQNPGFFRCITVGVITNKPPTGPPAPRQEPVGGPESASCLDWHRRQYAARESLSIGRCIEPKSASSKRAINVPRTLVEVLRTHKARQSEKCIQDGEAYQIVI